MPWWNHLHHHQPQKCKVHYMDFWKHEWIWLIDMSQLMQHWNVHLSSISRSHALTQLYVNVSHIARFNECLIQTSLFTCTYWYILFSMHALIAQSVQGPERLFLPSSVKSRVNATTGFTHDRRQTAHVTAPCLHECLSEWSWRIPIMN